MKKINLSVLDIIFVNLNYQRTENMKRNIYYLIILLVLTATGFTGSLSAKEKDGKVIQISAANYKQETAEGLVFVDFWAPWCGPCRTMNPILSDLAKEYKDVVKIAKVNADQNQLLSKTMKINVIPLIIVYKDGEEMTRIRGVVEKEKLVEVIKKYTAND